MNNKSHIEEIQLRGDDTYSNSLKDILFKWIKSKRKFEWIIFACFIIVFAFNLFSFINLAIQSSNIWFNYYHYFTIQTNLLILLVLLLYVINPNLMILNNNKLIFAAGCYIFITFLGFNAFLLPPTIKNSSNISIRSWFDMMGLHLATPVAYWTFVILQILYGKKSNIKMWKWIGYSVIYPLSYLTYLLLIPMNGISVVYDGSSNLFHNHILGHFPGDSGWLEINFKASDQLNEIYETLIDSFKKSEGYDAAAWKQCYADLTAYYEKTLGGSFDFRLVMSISQDGDFEIKIARSLIEGGLRGLIFPVSAVVLYFAITIFTYHLDSKFLVKFKK